MEITKNGVFDLIGISEEEFDQKYNDYLEVTEWLKDFKEKYRDAVLQGGMMPGDYPVTLKTKYIDLQVIYPKQKPIMMIDNNKMKITTIEVEEVDAETGEVIRRKVNAYDYFNTKPKAPSKPYVKEIKHE